LSIVDLPAPFGPMIAVMAPRGERRVDREDGRLFGVGHGQPAHGKRGMSTGPCGAVWLPARSALR
jgi:hypothetical protein